jgi:hypothetical protein
MRFIDDEYLLLSRTGRPSPGLNARIARSSERRVRGLALARAKPRDPPEPLVIRIPLPRPVYLVPRGRRDLG